MLLDTWMIITLEGRPAMLWGVVSLVLSSTYWLGIAAALTWIAKSI